MSGFNERIRALCAAFDRTESPEILREIHELEFQKRKAEDAAERERKARAAAEKQQPATANNLDGWVAVIDERVRGWFDYYFDDEYEQRKGNDRRGCYFDMIAKGMADLRRQLRAEVKDAIEKLQHALEGKLTTLERQADGRIESRAHEREVLIEETGGAITRTRDELQRAIGELRGEFKDALRELCNAFATELTRLEERLKTTPGQLPIVKNYCSDTVHYAGHLVVHQGATYQALRDTARAPPHVDDGVCIASAGVDGQSVRARGAFNATANYKRFDIVSFDGTAFIARRDNPGIPGISEGGWHLMCRAGGRGATGEVGPRGRPGARGARGEDAPTIVSWTLDRKNYCAVPTMSNGTQGAVLELRGLFEQYQLETSATI